MIVKYNINIEKSAINNNLQKLVNQIYKLLPLREEEGDWKSALDSIIVEVAGMQKLLFDHQKELFSLLCKLEGLYSLSDSDDFLLYRKIIFDCLSLISDIIKQCQN